MIKNPFDVIPTNAADLLRPDFAYNLWSVKFVSSLKLYCKKN